MIIRSRLTLMSLFCLLAMCLSACSDSKKEEVRAESVPILLQGKTMGTSYSVKFFSDNQTLRKESFYADIEALLKRINSQMSTYQEDSELSSFNEYRLNDRFLVSGDTALVVDKAIEIGQMTQGALDITVGPIVNLWGFGPEGRPEKAPTKEQINLARHYTGLEKLHVMGSGLAKEQPELYLDLSAIAKGFAVDKVADYLESKEVNDYLVDIGGEMRVKGKKRDGSNWKVAIEKPLSGSRDVQQIVNIGDNAIATSGDYRNYFETNGVRYSHTIDPMTGKPISHNLASVTVISKKAMDADAFATAFNVMGAEKALKFAEQQQIAIYLVVKSGDKFEVKYSPLFKPYLQ